MDVTTERDGELLVPEDLRRVGWDDLTVKPGSAHGTALLSGHLDNSAGEHGALHPLSSTKVGDTITLTTGKGVLLYRVTKVALYPKASLPNTIVAVDGPPQIAVVTCGGALVQGPDRLLHYSENVVVWATPST